MNREDELKALKAAQDTFTIAIKMLDYEEALFNGTICAMIESYAEYNNIDKFKLTAKIYANLRMNDHE